MMIDPTKVAALGPLFNPLLMAAMGQQQQANNGNTAAAVNPLANMFGNGMPWPLFAAAAAANQAALAEIARSTAQVRSELQ